MSKSSVAVIGASGALGQAFCEHFHRAGAQQLFAFSRSGVDTSQATHGSIDYADESSIAAAAELAAGAGPLDTVIVASGLLHNDSVFPEKSLRDLNTAQFQASFLANSIGPALVAKHFIPRMSRKQRGVFAALSARVGSIGDNRLGGWYAYRAAKAALNMLLKSISIETARTHPQLIVAGLHPGTVDSALSEPFQQRVPEGRLFTPQYSVEKLSSVIDSLSREDSGQLFAWDGARIPW